MCFLLFHCFLSYIVLQLFLSFPVFFVDMEHLSFPAFFVLGEFAVTDNTLG